MSRQETFWEVLRAYGAHEKWVNMIERVYSDTMW